MPTFLTYLYFADSDDFDREEVATYEAVARLFPRSGFFRPVVLVGPPGVGRNEVKRRILAMDPDRFRTTIPREFLSILIGGFSFFIVLLHKVFLCICYCRSRCFVPLSLFSLLLLLLLRW